MTIVEAPEEPDVLEQAQRVLQERQAARYRAIQAALDELKRELKFELVGAPRYVQDGNRFSTVADVAIVLIDE